MVATLNLYLDPELTYSWCDASLIAAKASGHGVTYAQNSHTWLHHYLHSGKLPMHCYGNYNKLILDDEDFAQDIQLHLTEIAKKEYIRAQDIVDYVVTPEVQAKLGTKAQGIHLRTARQWLHKLRWRYSRKQNSMYIEGHEREDVIKYQEEFVACWKDYKKPFFIYDNNGEVLLKPVGFPVPQISRFRLILVTYDESTFYKTDQCKTKWTHAMQKPQPEKKGEGQYIMVLAFLTSEWGLLRNENE
jgi:hypothetical protein